MIHIYMKEQYVARKERIIIKDEAGKDIYLITGKWGNVGDGLYLYKIDGTLVAEVKQTKLSLMPKFDIYLSGKKSLFCFKVSWYSQSLFSCQSNSLDY
ncbi:hypothetical protein BN1423_310009 [Carnobacterium maltaromaticum]|nr:hypothetical protein BN1423_310009 [Carnobacterium maltaromaticum]